MLATLLLSILTLGAETSSSSAWPLALGATAAPQLGAPALPLRQFTSDVAHPADRVATLPRYEWRKEVSLLGLGWGVSLLEDHIETARRQVPDQGLDADRIALEVDERSLGRVDLRAAERSDLARDAAIALPYVLSMLSAPRGERLRAPLMRAILMYEAESISDGIVIALKRGGSRPRPYAYGPESERAGLDVSSDEAFHSFPSGHAADAWRSAAFAITDHLLTRPRADWREHAAVGFVGGFLAGTTATLRVDAGMHFPSDVAAGSALGLAVGAGVPLLHHYVSGEAKAPWPGRSGWFGALAGTAAGLGAALLLAPAL